MLLLARKQKESIIIGDGIEVRVLRIEKGQVQLGITAPRNIPVHRQEIYKTHRSENQASSQSHLSDFQKAVVGLKKNGFIKREN